MARSFVCSFWLDFGSANHAGVKKVPATTAGRPLLLSFLAARGTGMALQAVLGSAEFGLQLHTPCLLPSQTGKGTVSFPVHSSDFVCLCVSLVPQLR